MKNFDIFTGKGIEACPECGAKMQCTQTDEQGTFVFCWKCSHHGPLRKSEATAVNAWNKEVKNRWLRGAPKKEKSA
jgi:hypothetical protein